MESTQLITLILTSTVVGGVAVKLIDVARDAMAGHMQKRRAEVDKAFTARDKALAEARWWDRWADVLEESLRVHRRQMIDAPCIDPADLPPYPSRPDKEKP